MKATSRNILAGHPAAGKILELYNEQLRENGKVNSKKFFEEVIKPEIPSYHLQSWYFFLKRFKISTGILPITISASTTVNTVEDGKKEITKTLLTNQEATNKLLQNALNISADRAQMILENPSLLGAKDAIELGLKAMKAQDSRMHAIGKVREDSREQEKFDRTFSNAAYE